MGFDDFFKSRVWNREQHPYRHSGKDFTYTNPAAPGVTDYEEAINFLFAVVRPNAQPAVDTYGDLPLVGNSIGDSRVVLDDGDGKQAGYTWEQREGDVSPKWYKTLDADWSTDSILAKFIDITLPLYVYKAGSQDLDENGDPITGLYAGQVIYGGELAGQNLTLNANSGDGVGPQSGFVQVDSQFRPTQNNLYDLSTTTERWRTGYFGTSVVVGTTTIGPASITDTSGSISFGDENLVTTGNINAATVTGTALVADNTTNSMTLVPGSITDTTGAISFGAANLVTTGTLGAGVSTFTQGGQNLTITPFVAGPDRTTIISSTGAIDFGTNNLTTTGSFAANTISASQITAGNLQLSGNTLTSVDANGNINLSPNGTGVVNITKGISALDAGFTGTVGVTGQFNVDNLRIDGNTLSSTNANGNVLLSPNGSGTIQPSASIIPNSDAALSFGSASLRYNTLYLSNAISNGTTQITMSDLLPMRNNIFRDAGRTQPAQTGDALFYDGVSGTWLASVPNSEITHSSLNGLLTGDAGHTQFVMLSGRSGGQTVLGGTAASQNLVLGSTLDATKGSVLFQDTLAPQVDATFSGGWQGTDIGSGSLRVRDIYSVGEHKGLRFENILSTSLPSFSAQTPGKVYWATDNSKAYVDTGTAIRVLGVSKFVQDTAWNGTDLTKDVVVSGSVADARNAIWQFMDNVNSFEIMSVQIRIISATTVRITTNVPLPAGNYRLIGIE